jgi:hypothetical protein
MVTFGYEKGIELPIFQVLPEEMGHFGLTSCAVEQNINDIR